MVTLIANIGTSDLAVKIDHYYIPIGFDRSEPNIDQSDLNEDEKAIWEQELRQSYITEILCPELNVSVRENRKTSKKIFSFLELTEKLFQAYEQDELTWHSRLRPGRIWGVIQTAQQQFNVQEINLFVTQQQPPHPSDSIYVFKILQKWFLKEHNLRLIEQQIPPETPANDADQLLNFYYNFFIHQVKEDQPLLVSTKGGTIQMKTALTMQSIASAVTQKLFIDPKLSIKKLLAGEPSQCQYTSYWRYMRSQKYRDIQILLERWDFEGASQLLTQWKKSLSFLQKYIDDSDLTRNHHLIQQVISALTVGNYCFNLDWKTIKNTPKLTHNISQRIVKEATQNDQLLNIYTQCRIYEELNQMTSFLTYISSFYEGVLEKIADQIGKRQEFRGLSSRRKKLDFINQQVERYKKVDSNDWLAVKQSLKSLDYWCSQRNKLIHGAEGISQAMMKKLYDSPERDKNACSPNKIIEVMTQILESNLSLIKPEYRKFVGKNAQYYIYSGIKEWSMNQLMNEGL
ncbi:MAG: hypothetical protein WBA77_00735 [Microcoleaceae cyanobacterium]